MPSCSENMVLGQVQSLREKCRPTDFTLQVVGLANSQPKKILIGALSIGATLVAQTTAGQPKLAGTDIAFGSVPVLRVGC